MGFEKAFDEPTVKRMDALGRKIQSLIDYVLIRFRLVLCVYIYIYIYKCMYS